MSERKENGHLTHTFIIRIWQEQPKSHTFPKEWRGVVEDIPDGQQRYFSDLNQILPILRQYLEAPPSSENNPLKQTDP